MFKWKSAEKLEKPKITEVIVEEKLNATTIVEQAEPVVLPSVPSTSAVDTNSVSDVPLPAALPSEQPSVDLDPLAKAQKAEHDEMPPELGDRYEVIEFIGSGGMGSVWKVYDKELKGTFAVKVLKPELLADAIAVKRFEKEANLASDLTHANIAAIFGPGTDSQGRPFIIMGYVDGDSLADILACEGKLSEERALDIFTQICEALSHSHMKGIIHRDIKPSNIIISKTESGGDMVHIVDFGIARCIYDEVTKTQALTKAVDIFGSPRYMSPEQFLGNSVTGQSDIYSLGCVFYEMLTGAPPFTDENPVKLILQHISETPDLSKVPPRLQFLLCECLAKEPELRAQKVDTLLERVAALGSNLFVNGQVTNLLHGLMAVVLIMCTSSIEIPEAACRYPHSLSCLAAVLFLWMYTVVVNRDNAGRSINYKILELNLFLAVIAGAIAECLALTHIPYVNFLTAPFLVAVTLFLILQPKVVATYSNRISAVTSFASSLESRFYSKHETVIQRIGLCLGHALLALLSFMVAASVFILVLISTFGVNFGSPDEMSFFMLMVSSSVFFNFAFVFMRLFVDVSTLKRTVRQSLMLSTKIQTVVVSFALIASLVLTTSVGSSGFNLLLRQVCDSSSNKQKELQLRLEALTYPDNLFANQARLVAADYLWGPNGRNSEALALGQQIIESKRERDPVTLAAAYVLRYRIRELKGQSGGDSADLDRAMSLLEDSQHTPATDLDSSLFNIIRPIVAESGALSIGELAVRNGDLTLGKRALELAKDLDGVYHLSSASGVKRLQTRVDALSAPKSDTPAEHK
ncbi:MAG: serine/threonine-protein kinase [Candidatus Obscuribacterales bacterium]